MKTLKLKSELLGQERILEISQSSGTRDEILLMADDNEDTAVISFKKPAFIKFCQSAIKELRKK